MYKILRSVLFWFDPEKVHYFSMNSLKMLCKVGFIKKWICSSFKPKGNIPYSLFHIQFPNKVGLGAGFDKNAKYLTELETLGFGFVEIGTVTPKPQAGNDKPRLFRLPKDKALELKDSQHWTDSLLLKYPHKIKMNNDRPMVQTLLKL